MGLVKVIRRSNGGVSSSKPVDTYGESLEFARGIYERLGDIVKNKELVLPVEATNQYESWLIDMEALGAAIDAGDTSMIPQSIKDFDAYLSTLNYTDNKYPFPSEYFESTPTLTVEGQREYRVVSDEDDGTYLTSGDELLIIYT